MVSINRLDSESNSYDKNLSTFTNQSNYYRSLIQLLGV